MKIAVLISGFLLIVFSYSFAGWVIETVDSVGNVGFYNSIALDSSNNPHISYIDETDYGSDLKYAYFNGSNWQVSTVIVSGGYFTSLALDSSNNPHISYYHSALKYAYNDGSNWQITTIDSAGDVGAGTSIIIDSDDKPHIAYLDKTNWPITHLKYAYYNGMTWLISTVDTVGGLNPSIALDNYNNPHISYYNNTNGDLKYAYNNGPGWQITTVDSLGDVGDCSSIALDSSNNPHISYKGSPQVSSGFLKYAKYDDNNWQISTLEDVGPDGGGSTSISLDSSNNPRISYEGYLNLKYTYYDGSSWHFSTIDSIAGGDGDNSMALDGDSNPHISYCSFYGDLKYAHYIPYTGVSLLSFAAQPQPNSDIKLVWQVAASDDTQMVGFNLYRSGAAKARKKDWTRLNTSPISPNQQCQYVDSSVQAGQGYQYRLSALTADGKEEMLGTAQGEAGTTPAVFALTAVYPNPTSSLLTCCLTMPQAGSVTLGLYDIYGRLVLSKRMELASGEQNTALEVGNLARGIYTVRASSGGESATKRVVVMR